jgi:hypothetical protein
MTHVSIGKNFVNISILKEGSQVDQNNELLKSYDKDGNSIFSKAELQEIQEGLSEASGKNQLDYYKSDYNCLYPPTRAGGNDNMAELIRLIEWVDDSSDEVFKDNIRNYFDLEYLLRYYLFVLIFGAVDSLGKNMKLATWDGRIWYPQVYDADTTIGLDNTGFLKFDMDIEMGDEGVFNTTGSKLWKKVVLLFQEQLKTEYALMRQDRFTVENIMKYLYEEQIAKIPATFYNKDMRTKYLNFGSSYLYALHGSSEQHIKKWIKERIMYVDTLLGYEPSSADYITLRSSKLGYVYLDIQAYIPMYVSVKWRNEPNNAGLQTKRVGRGETVRFEYNMPTATDQEIFVYAGHYLKSLGDVSNLEPTSMLIANADRLTEIECHSPNLINTDLSECKLLQRIDLSDSTALGTGLGAQPTLKIQNCKYLKYCNCHNTKLTAIYTMSQGGNLEEIYYPASTQVIQLQNQEYLHTVGIPYDESKDIACKNLQQVTIENCKNVKYIQYPFKVGEPLNFKAFKYVQNLNLENSLDGLTAMKFTGFNELKTVRLSSLENLSSLNFDDMLQIFEESKLTSIEVSDCPLITTVTFNVSNADRYKVEFAQGCNINLGGVRTIKTIECNTNIIGLDTLIIPTSTKELKFIRTASGEVNDIKSIFSATANHTFDGFVGLDLKDIELTYLDMSSLGITSALNFYVAPTTQHPNLNTYRDGVNQPYFCPEGELDLTNYEGNMRAMFKGLDFNKLKIKMPTREFSDLDISSLFEGATLTNDINVGFLLSKFPYANNFDYIFKNSNVSDITSILFPSHRFSLREGFMNTLITQDISLPLQVTDVTRCFKDCIHITKVTSNWTKSFSFNPSHEECYAGCVNIEYIDGKEGAIHNIPVDWGGFGFIKGLMGKYTVEILSDNYLLRLGDLVDEGTVEWGDGTYTIGENSHLFTYSGIYTIYGKIYPNIEREEPHVSLSSVLINVSEIPYAYATTYRNMFSNCSLLRYIDLSTTDTRNIEDMSGMFRNCVSMFTPPILDYSNVSNVDEMFMGCREIYEIIFENLTNKNMTIENFVDGCMGLTTIEFRGKVDKEIGRKVIEGLNTFILENFANEINYANEISMLSLRTTEIEDEQDTQGEQIEELEMSQTVQEEQLMETMMAMTSMYEAIGVMMSSFANEENALNDFDKQMVKIYTTLVIKGYKKIEDIPILLREIVKKNIEK